MDPARERRRFNSSERVALYLAADGKCTNCGADLKPGWHGDHVMPYAAGGPTDVINGEALCPPCNLKKGAHMKELRDWQADALARFLKNNADYLCVATPGAGKTTFALTAAQRMMESGEINRLVVVVPTAHLRGQWAGAAARFGIQLDNRFSNGNAVLAKDFDGTVVCYATVAAQPLLWRKIATAQRTLVILDEVHHAGEHDHLTWGNALREAFEPGYRRLLLSGTPFRSDGQPIPFVTYEGGKCVASFNYDYGMALADREVVRPIAFPVLDGTMRWRDAGVVATAQLATVDEKYLSQALDTAFDPSGEWINSVFRRANDELERLRQDVPDAGGLVVAADQRTARAYAKLLEAIAQETPTVAISDDPEASDQIKRFAEGSSRWIIAVQMVAEGVDIPRLAIGVYASRIATEMFFRQVAGRFVRMRGRDDETTATLFLPSVEPLLSFAAKIEQTVEAVLAEEERRLRERAERGPRQTTLSFDLVEPLDSSEAVHLNTILGGEAFTDEELHRAEWVAQASQLPSSFTPLMLARALRVAGAGRVVGTATVASPAAAAESPRLLADEKTRLRQLIQRKVGKLNRQTGAEHAHINADLNRYCHDTVKTATIETLDKRLNLLDQWLAGSSR